LNKTTGRRRTDRIPSVILSCGHTVVNVSVDDSFSRSIIVVASEKIHLHFGEQMNVKNVNKISCPSSHLTFTNEIIAPICITGSALALHCCKAHAKINSKIENSTPSPVKS